MRHCERIVGDEFTRDASHPLKSCVINVINSSAALAAPATFEAAHAFSVFTSVRSWPDRAVRASAM